MFLWVPILCHRISVLLIASGIQFYSGIMHFSNQFIVLNLIQERMPLLWLIDRDGIYLEDEFWTFRNVYLLEGFGNKILQFQWTIEALFNFVTSIRHFIDNFRSFNEAFVKEIIVNKVKNKVYSNDERNVAAKVVSIDILKWV